MAPPEEKRGLDNKEMQRQLKERKEEMLLFERFKRIASLKLEAMTRQSEESGIKFQMGEPEKQVFRQMSGMGIKEGIAAGIVTFLVLRRGPIYVARWVYQRRMAKQAPPGDGSYQLSPPTTPTSTGSTGNPFQTAIRPDFPRSRNVVVRTIWFAFDSVLSLMMAASVSMAYTDTDHIRQQLVELPLLQGRSLTADTLCDDIVQELQKIKEEQNPAYQRLSKLNRLDQKTPASFYLEAIEEFCQNCQRRRYVEQQLRQEQGLKDNEPVAIPKRVPSNGPRLLLTTSPFQNSGMDLTNHDDNEEPFTDDDSDFQNFDWASDLTTDQQDDIKPSKKK